MNSYVVAIRRTYIHGRNITVSAETEEEAEKKALEQIGDHDLSIVNMKEDEDFAEVQYKL
jgi:hypothetical protein